MRTLLEIGPLNPDDPTQSSLRVQQSEQLARLFTITYKRAKHEHLTYEDACLKIGEALLDMALYDICEKVQFAENNESESLLVTDPLRNLGKHFSMTLPNVVLSGAKGAGKTFTFLQVFN